ncbi:MAG: alpha/beta hydrolase [Burkholderiaceae bacterium]|nr:alpha/beta hydrolase [Burkholderiaceae bacterium]
MQRFRQFILFGLIFILSACSSTLWLSDTEIANTISEPARLKIKNYKAGQFIVHGRERYDNLGSDLNIYLEGDGLAWVSRREPSRDPTPDDPIGLRLAAIDPAPNVIWLARPCQYTFPTESPRCKPYYWTNGRFAPEIVDAIDQAITAAKLSAKATKIHLIGYSGGGGLAVLIAAQRNDVVSVRTVAGNIDHPAFTSLHRVTPMSQSLDPASVARRINMIPQWHFFGADDKVVPKLIGESYIRKAGESSCLHMHVVPNVSHDKGWELLWPRLLQETNRAMITKDCSRPLQ